MKRFGIITTAMPARGSKWASSTRYVPNLTWRLFHLAGVKHGMQVIFFRAEDVDFAQARVHAWSCYSVDGMSKWFRSYHPLPNVVFENCYLNLVCSDPRILQVKNAFMKKGIPTFNPGLFNKSGLNRVLNSSAQTKAYLPPSLTVNRLLDVVQFLKMYRLIYLKPVNGSGGAGILQFQLLNDNRIHVKSERFYKDKPFQKTMSLKQWGEFTQKQILRKKYIVQQGLRLIEKDGQKIDFRVVVHRGNDGKWESVGIRPKLGKVGSIVTNSHAGGSKTTWMKLNTWAKSKGVRLPAASELETAAILVGQKLTSLRPTLSHLGIDVAVDQNLNVYVLDINPRPGRDLLTREMLLKVTDRTAGFASYLANQKQSNKAAR